MLRERRDDGRCPRATPMGGARLVEAAAQRYRATLEQRREAQSLRHCIEVMSASPDDAAVVREMPVDGSCGPARIRHCPWQHTAAGCPRLSSCPLSHKPLPPDWQPTWKYRLWALENHEGWTGEASNRKFARVHAL